MIEVRMVARAKTGRHYERFGTPETIDEWLTKNRPEQFYVRVTDKKYYVITTKPRGKHAITWEIALKKLKEGARFNSAICAAWDCRAPAAQLYAEGAAFPAAYGIVPLCARHGELRLEFGAAPTERPLSVEDVKVSPEKTKLPEPSARLLEATEGLHEALSTERGAIQRETTDAQEALQLVSEFEIQTRDDMEFAAEALTQTREEWLRLHEAEERATKPMQTALEEVQSWFRPAKTFYQACERIWQHKIREAALNGYGRKALGESRSVTIPDTITYTESWAWECTNPEKVPRSFLALDTEAVNKAVRSMKGRAKIPGIRIWELAEGRRK